METEASEIAPMVESLLESFTVTPPLGAAVERTTGNVDDWPERRTVFDGRLMEPSALTVTPAVPLVTFAVVVLAVMVVTPAATPPTCTGALLAFAGIVTDAGTLTIPAGLALRFTVICTGVGAD